MSRDNIHEESQNSNRGRRILSVLCSVIGIVAIVMVLLIMLTLFVPRLFGCEVFHVISGSMDPTIPVGSMVVVQKNADPEQAEEGDVIAFYLGSSVVTHRVVRNDMEKRELITKGDANEAADISPVPYDNYIGKVIFDLPVLGRLQAMATGTTEKIWLVCILIAGVLLQVAAVKLRR